MDYKYNWNNYPGVKLMLNKLYKNTLSNLNNDLYKTKILLDYFEDYLRHIYQYGYNLNEVILKLHSLNSLSLASNVFIDNESLNVKRQYVSFGPNLVINDYVRCDELLNKEERIRLNMYAGLSHIIINLDNIDSKYFNKIYNELDNYETVKSEFILANGWHLLDKTMSEQLAEEITYSTLRIKRPLLRMGVEKQDYFPIDNSLVISNLEMYRPFDNIIPNLAKTLNFIKIHDANTLSLTHSMLKQGVNDNLSRNIINDYLSHDNEFELYSFIYLIGLLGIEKEAVMGIRILPELKLDKEETKKIMILIKEILSSQVVLNSDKFKKAHNVDYNNINKNEFVKRKLKKLITERNI